MVRRSRPSLTTRVRLGRFRRIPERRDGCNVQTVQTTDLPNSSRVPFNQHSQANTTSQRVESKAAGVKFQLRSGGTSGFGRDTNNTLRTECEFPGEKTRKSELSTQRSLRAQHPVELNTVFTQSSPEDREVDKEQGHQPKDWSCNKVRPQTHSSSGSRTAGQVSPLDVGYLRGSGVLQKIATKFRQSRRLIGDTNFKPHTADVAGILNLSKGIILQRTIEPVTSKTVSQEAWLLAPGRVCKHLRSFSRKVSILRRLQRLSSVLLNKSKQILTSVTISGRSQGSTAAEQGMPQMRLGRSRHSLQAALEDQNLQAERSANVLCWHRRALSFLRGERSSNESAVRATSFRNGIQEPTLK